MVIMVNCCGTVIAPPLKGNSSENSHELPLGHQRAHAIHDRMTLRRLAGNQDLAIEILEYSKLSKKMHPINMINIFFCCFVFLFVFCFPFLMGQTKFYTEF